MDQFKRKGKSYIGIILFLLGIILVIRGTVGMFQFFQNIPDEQDVGITDSNIDKEIVDEIKTNGSISPEGINTSNESEITGHSIDGYKKSKTVVTQIASSGIWKATDYIIGDIISDTYTVQSGDTLWEIAEAYYGSGFEWKRILASNKSSIGYLPNGTQAKIMPGQVLYLPGKEN